jgi:hypothetical protein
MALVGFACAWAPPACAEPSSAGVGRQGRPLPDQRAFTITEVGAYRLLDEDPISGGGDLEFVCDVGRMWNVSPKHALGGTVFAELGGNHQRGGARMRWRYWLARRVSTDLTGGFVLLMREGSSADVDLPIPMLGASINLTDLLSVSVGVERGRYEHWESIGPGAFDRRRFTDWNWRVGGSVGSAPGMVGTGLFIVATCLAIQLSEWD